MNSPAVNDPFLFRALFAERFTFYRMHLKRLFEKCQNDFDRTERVQCHRFLPTPLPPNTTYLFLLRFKIMSFATLPLCCDIPHLKASYMFSWIPVVWGWALNKKKQGSHWSRSSVSKQLWVFNTICRSAGDCVIKPVKSTSEGRTVVLIRSLLKSLDHGRADTLYSPRLSSIR